ncbi:NADH-quinone oxidoreductase subunit NuoF [Candidatus Hydrogenedentota bacterium]
MPENRMNSPEDLEQWKDAQARKQEQYKARVLICMTGCRALGAADIAVAFRDEVEKAGLSEEVEIVETGCIGLCAGAPVVLIEPYEYLYGGVKPGDVPEIVEQTLKQGKSVASLTLVPKGSAGDTLKDVPFYSKQQKLVLENCGRIDPQSLDSFVERGGYSAAVNALHSMKPEEVIEQMVSAGLRGRGGAGFPAGLKWRFCRQAPGNEKYLICNADEGDPGAFMDRALLEGDPHRVIEGMIIAAYAIGASKGFIYVRAEYPIAVEHVMIALERSRATGLLGDNIAGAGFSFDIELRMGAGAFVCGEETALIASLEGKRGVPRPRPPFPATSGYHGKPTNINNVESLANVPLIMKNGADWYSAIGTEKSKGTKIFALAGKVNNTGLVEVPMGATLREIIFDIGNGIPKKRKFKAAQMGGPSGGCIPEEHLDLEADYDSLQEVGAMMGSGGLIVMDERTCMVDIARYFMTFVQEESCGKCTPCRVGTKQVLNILENICAGNADPGDLARLETLGEQIKKASLCGLGQTAANPILSTIRYFRDEYEAHINEKKCPSGVCQALVNYSIDAEKCTGCGLCIKKCPTDAIVGEKKEPHDLDEHKCVKCGVCFDICPFDAIRPC